MNLGWVVARVSLTSIEEKKGEGFLKQLSPL